MDQEHSLPGVTNEGADPRGAVAEHASNGKRLGIGFAALQTVLAVAQGEDPPVLSPSYRLAIGQAGSMAEQPIYAAVLSVARRNNLVGSFREVHGVYHAAEDAFFGVLRGGAGLGGTLRTVGLLFTICRGPLFPDVPAEGDWVAVAMFGTVGIPNKGWEHEVVGLGILHV